MAKNGKHVGGAPAENTNRLTHGLRRSIDALSDGTPLKGLAHELRVQATGDREEHGALWVQKKLADRLVAVADLAWGLALDAQELDRIDYFLVRFARYGTRGFRMLEVIRQAEAARGDDSMWKQVTGNE